MLGARNSADPAQKQVNGGQPDTALVARSRDRFIAGIRFPILIFAIWRLAHIVMVRVAGRRILESAYLWDGANYLQILRNGYWNPRPSFPVHAFFPGLAWLAEPIQFITDSQAITVAIVANGTALAAFITVWGVSRAWVGEAIARRSVLLFALFPSSLFLWAFYSEGLFIALSAGAVWADRRGRHVIAAVCLGALCTTRSVGVLVPLALILLRVVRMRRIDRWALAYAEAAVAGVMAVLVTMEIQVGNPLAFMGVQKDWGRSISWPWVSVWQGIENLTPQRGTVMVPALIAREFDLVCVGLVIGAIGILVLSRKPRFPPEAWVLAIALMALPFCSSVLPSFNRFTLATWMIFPAYAAMLGRTSRRIRGVLLGVVALASIAVSYSMVASFTVPYGLRNFIG